MPPESSLLAIASKLCRAATVYHPSTDAYGCFPSKVKAKGKAKENKKQKKDVDTPTASLKKSNKKHCSQSVFYKNLVGASIQKEVQDSVIYGSYGCDIVQKPIGVILQKEVQKSDVLLLSGVEPRDSQSILGLRCAWAVQTSLPRMASWTQTSFARGYKTRRQEFKASDEDQDNPKDRDQVKDDFDDQVLDEQQISDSSDYEVLDEQRISDSEDDELDEDYISDDDDIESKVNEGETEKPAPMKKKFPVNAPKAKPVDEGPILNENITAKSLRLVDDEGRGHKIVSRDEALFLAKRKKLDLVLVDRRSDPPVCKIFDFKRTMYQKEQVKKDQKKKKGAAAKLNEVKELRYTAKTELKDLKMKVDKAKQFLDRGYKVKFVANFPGFVEEEADRLKQGNMIYEVISMMDDVATIEQGPRFEGRLVWVMFKHTKFGKQKKKAAKPAGQPVGKSMETEPDEEYATASLKV